MTATRPPLPVETLHDGQHIYFTAGQMRAYGAACAAAEREARQPLTDEQIGDVARQCYIDITQENEDSICTFARAIEHAHGIGSKP